MFNGPYFYDVFYCVNILKCFIASNLSHLLLSFILFYGLSRSRSRKLQILRLKRKMDVFLMYLFHISSLPSSPLRTYALELLQQNNSIWEFNLP